MTETIIILFMILFWIYLTICLFFILTNSGNLYVDGIPFVSLENNIEYYTKYYIPLFLFTNRYNKIVEIPLS